MRLHDTKLTLQKFNVESPIKISVSVSGWNSIGYDAKDVRNLKYVNILKKALICRHVSGSLRKIT